MPPKMRLKFTRRKGTMKGTYKNKKKTQEENEPAREIKVEIENCESVKNHNEHMTRTAESQTLPFSLVCRPPSFVTSQIETQKRKRKRKTNLGIKRKGTRKVSTKYRSKMTQTSVTHCEKITGKLDSFSSIIKMEVSEDEEDG